MDTVIIILGILTALFFLLAMTNAMTQFTKHSSIVWIASKHKIFGMLASLTALIHMIIAIIDGQLKVFGLLALIALILTGMFGMLFYKLKQKNLYIMHRIMGPITFVLIIIHVITNLI